jgi:hypothetical protein
MVVRALLDKSGDTIHWLQEKGVKFRPYVRSIWPGQDPVNWHEILGPGPAWLTGSGELTRVLVRNCEDLKVKFFTNSRVKRAG